jgi:hypothetical protein
MAILQTAGELAAQALKNKAAAPAAAPLKTAAELAMSAPASAPARLTSFVNPGGQITSGEFFAGGAPAKMYPMFDPKGGGNISSVMENPGIQAFRQGYNPGQYTAGMAEARGPLALRPTSTLAAAPEAALAAAPEAGAGARAATTIFPKPIAGAASESPLLLGAGKATATTGGVLSKSLPFLGDALQGAAYGYEGKSVGRGVAAGLGSLGGRTVGAGLGTLTAPVTGPFGTITGQLGGSMVGAYGAAKLYDKVTGTPLTAADGYLGEEPIPVETPEASLARAAGTAPALADARRRAAQTGYDGDISRAKEIQDFQTRRAAQSGRPEDYRRAGMEPAIPAAATPSNAVPKQAAPSAPSAPTAKPAQFQMPTADEMARFRKETGTPFNPKSINDKLSLDRMRAGEETFDSKQANAYRKANPGYRPGQYSKAKPQSAAPAPGSNSDFQAWRKQYRKDTEANRGTVSGSDFKRK